MIEIRKYNMHVVGHSLIYAVAAMIIFSSISLLLLSTSNFTNKLVQSTIKKDLGGLYSYQGLELLNNEDIEYNKYYSYEFEDGLELTIRKDFWGLYEKYTSTVIVNKIDTICTKTALVGRSNDTSDRTALLLTNSSSVLSVTKNVSINGKCYLPNALVKKQASNSNIILPEVFFESPDSMPSLNDFDLFTNQFFHKNADRNGIIVLNDSIVNNFRNNTVEYISDTIIIAGYLSGNIILDANVIIVLASAGIKNAILRCAHITLPDDFIGDLQLFATKTINIGSNVQLEYPSIVCLLYDQMNKRDVDVEIKDSFSLKGDIYLLNTEMTIGAVLKKSCKITGGIYSAATIQLNNICHGPVICKSLINKSSTITQMNLAQDMTIDIDSLPSYYVYSSVFPKGRERKIITWCN